MTDAEKFAKVFRAAADGVANGVFTREQYDSWVKDDHEGVFRPGGYEAEVRRALLRRGSDHSLAMFDAFSGVAVMFEKIAESEA